MPETKAKISTAQISLITSVILGISFVYLFTWKTPGISYMIFFLVALLSSFLPIFSIKQNKPKSRRLYLLLALPIVLALSSVFFYRLNQAFLFLSFISLPIVFAIYIAALHADHTFSKFGILSYITLPFRVLLSWFADAIKFIKDSAPKNKQAAGTDKAAKRLKRVLIGILLAVPFIVIFAILLSSADQIFGDFLAKLFSNVIGEWLRNNLPSFVARLMIASVIAIYYSVYNYALWNPDSVLRKWMANNEHKEIGESKRNWDVIISSTFLIALNILFLAFVAIQFVYLFGGSENVIGANANFTYAEYARRGFWELLFVSILAYFVILVLNFKVHTQNKIQKAVFYGNSTIMILSILVITFSAHTRLSLYENVYGFTRLRLFVHFTIACIAAMYIALLASPFIKNVRRYISITTSILVFVAYSVILLVPADSIIARSNIKRYGDTNKIDVSYLLTLSDEAIPQLISLANNSSDTVHAIIMANLQERYEKIKLSRPSWPSYNISHEKNLVLLSNAIGNTDWSEEAKRTAEIFCNSYFNSLEQGTNLSEIYAKYWDTNATEESDLQRVAPHYNFKIENASLSLPISDYADEAFPYDSYHTRWYNGLEINYTLQYTYNVDNVASEKTANDSIVLYFINGEWRIEGAYLLNLGYDPTYEYDATLYRQLFSDYEVDYEVIVP